MNTIGVIQATTTFLATSNGLASGNHILEALEHALCEVIERDTQALDAARGMTDSLKRNMISLGSDLTVTPRAGLVPSRIACAIAPGAKTSRATAESTSAASFLEMVIPVPPMRSGPRSGGRQVTCDPGQLRQEPLHARDSRSTERTRAHSAPTA